MKILGKEQPWSIVVLATLLIIAAVMGIIGAIATVSISVFLPVSSAVAVVAIIIAAIYIVLAYGLLIHHVVVWWLVFVFSALGLLGALIILFSIGISGLISVAISVVIVAIMLHKDTISAINPLKPIDVDWPGWSFE